MENQSETASLSEIESKIKIRKAAPADLPRLLEIYGFARDFMVRTGNPDQWKNGGPNREQLEKDIALQQLYVMEDASGMVHAFFMFSLETDHTYDVIEDGFWKSDKPYGVIHRVAGDGQIRGVLARAVDFALQRTPHLRIDTHRDNKVMQGAIAKSGFAYCGIIHLEDGSPRLAYERV